MACIPHAKKKKEKEMEEVVEYEAIADEVAKTSHGDYMV